MQYMYQHNKKTQIRELVYTIPGTGLPFPFEPFVFEHDIGYSKNYEV